MTKDEAIESLNKLDGADQEEAHITADQILKRCLESIGYGEVTQAYDKASDRIGFWYA